MPWIISLALLGACDIKTTPDTGPTTDTPADTADTDTDTDTDTGPVDTIDPDDLDGDGSPAGVDCDDDNPDVYPGATERCNGEDDDCDGSPAEGEVDADKDKVLDCAPCAEAGYWPGTLAVDSDASLNAVMEASQPSLACDDYKEARDYLFGALDSTGGKVEGIYAGEVFSHDPDNPDWDTVNTEHVWPRSQGAQYEPVECDLHHLFPADAQINTLRGSLPYGVVRSVEWQSGGSKHGTDASGDEVFEPRDARKGDLARALLYIAARYPDEVELDGQRSAARLSLLQDWSRQDPPDEAEIARTWKIADRQGAANPFVVCPDLADRL